MLPLPISSPLPGLSARSAYQVSHVKRENVEAMFDTVRTYGKY